MDASVSGPATSTEELIRRLALSPRLPQVVERFQALLKAEQERRQRFYEEISETQKAEFINGEIIVHTPVKWRHSLASENLFSLLKAHIQKHRLGYVGHEKVLVALTRNDYEPDICYFTQDKVQAFSPDQVKFPAPDLVVEVLSESTEAIDRGVKLEDYALHGVGEYWIVDAEQETVEQYVLKGKVYELAVKVKSGTLQSHEVASFEIPVRAIFDSEEHLRALQEILS